MPMVTRVENVSIRQQTAEDQAECYSADLQQIHIELRVLFRIPESSVVKLLQEYFGEPFESLVKMQIFKVTPEFVTEIRNEGLTDVSVEDIVKLRIFKIDAAYIRQAKADGVPLEVEKLVQRKIGVGRN